MRTIRSLPHLSDGLGRHSTVASDKDNFVVMTSRGRWDRSATAEERAGAHRASMVRAAARAVFELGRSVTVADILERAGVGRNTFYVHFTDLTAALRAAEDHALELVTSAISSSSDAPTPIERLRRGASDWLSLAAREPEFVMLAVRGDGTVHGSHSRVRGVLIGSLGRIVSQARSAGVLGRPVDALRLRAVAGAFVATAEAVVEDPLRPDVVRLAEGLVDLALRAFR